MTEPALSRVVLVLFVAGVTAASAAIRLPQVFADHMVIQRECPVPVWGWATPGKRVSVRLDQGEPVAATAAADGAWSVALPPRAAGGPFRLTVAAGADQVVVEDVLVGEVWLCSGQSNMQWTVASSEDAQAEIAAANHPRIRHLAVQRRPASLEEDDVAAAWQACTPETVGGFTAVGYFFGRALQRELDVPVGLINASWGGTRIEPWIPPVGFERVPELADVLDTVHLADPRETSYKERLTAHLDHVAQWLTAARGALTSGALLEPVPPFPPELVPLARRASPQQQPTTLYNGMIRGLVPFALRGAIWYQGESNHRDGMAYVLKTRALVEGWRRVWDQGPFPFYYVQIAPYHYGNEDPHVLPVFWEAQAAALAIPNTGMAVIHDVGNTQDIHPRNKQEVGRRLALIALAKTYGRDEVVWSGPVFRELSVEGRTLRVRFDHVAEGLQSADGKPLTWFEIIGRETDFVSAEARIEGDCVVLSAPEVQEPMAVRFGWHKTAEPNLQNSAGLPARPFRAGEVPELDYLKLRIPEAADYRLVYDLDLGNLGRSVTYDVDTSRDVTWPFDRVAYFLELQKPGESVRYVYVSMDAFSDDPAKLGVPVFGSGASFQQHVGNLTVISNVDGMAAGENLAGGNIEFWPNNYSHQNQAGVPHASDSLWDFGDEIRDPVDGHGCMQVHNYEARQTIFAINHWRAGADASIGIGNSDGRTRDWTFVNNASEYVVKRLRILVRPRPVP